ncbi:MAG: glycosyltransferase [Candidatus Omnitrophota bacterium]
MKILAIVHRAYVGEFIKPGGLDRFFAFLQDKGEHSILSIEHPIFFKGPAVIRSIDKEGINVVKKTDLNCSYLPAVKLVIEFFFNLKFALSAGGKFDAIICADPFNLFSGYVIKKITGARVLIFHSADYADRRFSSFVLNRIYQFLYRLALRRADFVFTVSSRMYEKAKEALRARKDDKVIFFPNAPEFAKTPKRPHSRDSRNCVILVGYLIREYNYSQVLEAVSDSLKEAPRLLLKVVGEGEGVAIIKNIASSLGIEKNIIFLGALPQEMVLSEMANSDIGLACYARKDPWDFYRDSMKIREYASCGLPVIADDSTSTAQDAEKNNCCLIFRNKEDLKQHISKLSKDNEYYNTLAKASLSWGRENDGKLVFEKTLARIENYTHG